MNELELNAVVNWTDTNNQKHTGVVVDIIPKNEDELLPACVVIRNYEDNLEEVFIDMIESAVNPNGKVIRPNE